MQASLIDIVIYDKQDIIDRIKGFNRNYPNSMLKKFLKKHVVKKILYYN